MVVIDDVPQSDLPALRRLHNESTDSDVSLAEVEELHNETPELFVGAYEDGTLAGYCMGLADQPHGVRLAGIGVREAFQRRGIGAELLAEFEAHAAELGHERVSLGCTGDVAAVYVDCGYRPDTGRVSTDDPPSGYRDTEYDIVEETVEGDTTVVYVDAEAYESGLLESVREAFGDPGAVYIMEKYLDPGSGGL